MKPSFRGLGPKVSHVDRNHCWTLTRVNSLPRYVVVCFFLTLELFEKADVQTQPKDTLAMAQRDETLKNDLMSWQMAAY